MFIDAMIKNLDLPYTWDTMSFLSTFFRPSFPFDTMNDKENDLTLLFDPLPNWYHEWHRGPMTLHFFSTLFPSDTLTFLTPYLYLKCQRGLMHFFSTLFPFDTMSDVDAFLYCYAGTSAPMPVDSVLFRMLLFLSNWEPLLLLPLFFLCYFFWKFFYQNERS